MSNDANSSEQNGSTEAQEVTQMQKLQEEADKFKNEYLYLRAEFENYKRNSIKERSDLSKYGAERIVRDLLEAVDNFERALSFEVTAENYKTFVQGVQMTQAEIKGLLNKHGVTEVITDGSAFDPSVHEALSAEPSNEVAPGYVLKTFKKAYKLHDKLIRPAQVIVASKPDSQ